MPAEIVVGGNSPKDNSMLMLIPGDFGRPITELVSELDDPDLIADSREVLRSLS